MDIQLTNRANMSRLSKFFCCVRKRRKHSVGTSTDVYLPGKDVSLDTFNGVHITVTPGKDVQQTTEKKPQEPHEPQEPQKPQGPQGPQKPQEHGWVAVTRIGRELMRAKST